MGRAVVLVLVPMVAAAFLVRTAAVLLVRRRWPTAAAAVERWWLWLPLAGVLIAVTVVSPLVGLLATVVTAVVLTRVSIVGSPFRPR